MNEKNKKGILNQWQETAAEKRREFFCVSIKSATPSPPLATYIRREPCEIRDRGDFARRNLGGGDWGVQPKRSTDDFPGR
jgi:hypothetical protein